MGGSTYVFPIGVIPNTLPHTEGEDSLLHRQASGYCPRRLLDSNTLKTQGRKKRVQNLLMSVRWAIKISSGRSYVYIVDARGPENR